MRKNVLAKSFAVGVAACVALTGSVWAAAPETKEDDAAVVAAAEEALDKAVDEALKEVEAEVDKAVDEALAEAFTLNVTNKTGEDITYFNIYEVGSEDDPEQLITMIQEALIELEFLDDVADGSFGPKSQAALELFLEENNLSGKTKEDEEVLDALFGEYDDGNLLEEGKPLKKDESTEFVVLPEAEAEDAEDAEAETKAEVEYYAVFRLAGDEEKEYTLHVLPMENADVDVMLAEDGYAYVEYKTADSKEAVSTLEDEKVFSDADQARADYSNFATYGDDGGYGDYGDYSYSAPAADYSYSAPAAPAYDTSWINAAQGADDCANLGEMGATW